MRHHGQPVSHAHGDVWQFVHKRPMPIRDRVRKSPRDIAQVGHVLQRQRMIHGAALELSAIWQDLFRHLRGQNGKAALEPAFGFGPVEIEPGKHERFSIGKQMIAEQMPFQPPSQPSCLHRKAMTTRLAQDVARERPLDPVHDPQRGRIRLPS